MFRPATAIFREVVNKKIKIILKLSNLYISDQRILCCILSFGWFPVPEFYMTTFRNTLSHLDKLTPPMKMEQSVPKRRYIKFRRRGITQKKEYNIQNTAKVWNQERIRSVFRPNAQILVINNTVKNISYESTVDIICKEQNCNCCVWWLHSPSPKLYKFKHLERFPTQSWPYPCAWNLLGTGANCVVSLHSICIWYRSFISYNKRK